MPAPNARLRRSGPRRHQITFQSIAAATQDASGAPQEAATDVVTQWASIEPLTGGESWVPPQLSGTVTHRIATDYFAGITTKHRIKFGTRYFDINLLRNLEERGIQFEILAKEAV